MTRCVPAGQPRGRGTRGTAAAAALALSGAALLLLPTPAGADPLHDARTRAAALAHTVATLQTQAEVATEHYDAVESELGQAVTARMLAQRDLDGAQSVTAEDRHRATNRVRALYESGGTAVILAAVLGGETPGDAMRRYHDVSAILNADRAATADAARKAAAAATAASRLATLAARITRLQTDAAKASRDIATALQAQQQAYAAATREVRQLAAAAAEAAAARSAADFAKALAGAGGSLTGTTTPPSPIAAAAIAAARTKLGDPYLWGGTGPNAYDCSGLTQFAYSQAGVALPRVAADQWSVGARVDLAQLLPGDLLFWATNADNPATIHHVAIYLGNGMMLAAPHTGDVVKVQPVYLDGYFGATRPWSSH